MRALYGSPIKLVLVHLLGLSILNCIFFGCLAFELEFLLVFDLFHELLPILIA